MRHSESSPAASPTAIRKSGELKNQYSKYDDWLASVVVAIKFWRPGTAGGPLYVIGGQAVPGRNTIILTAGLSDLMDGLQAERGANVIVV